MNIIDCFWELDNIGKSTAELSILPEEVPDENQLVNVCNNYEYVVAKVPMCNIEFNYVLSKLGFVLMEVQMNVSMEVAKFDYKLVQNFIGSVCYREVTTKVDFERVLNLMTPDMFSTDRVSLDSSFGPIIGLRRYRNWIKTEFDNKRSNLVMVSYENNDIGFMLYRIEGTHFRLLLNGLYKEWQGRHMGVITPSSPLLYIKQNSLNEIDKSLTSISSNNIPAVKLYNRLGFILDSETYVFVKHNKN